VQEIKLGLIPSPGLPAELTSNFVNELPGYLSSHVDHSVTWKPEIIIEPLVGSAEYLRLLMDKAINLKHKNNWDYVICITDLPQFMDKHVVVADINTFNRVALISIPAFGAFPMKHRTKRTIRNILKDIHEEVKLPSLSRQQYKTLQKKPWFSFVKRMTLHNTNKKQSEHQQDAEKQDKTEDEDDENKDEETQEDTESQTDTRYIVKSKLIGKCRLLLGMTVANRPWTALLSFKKILMLAFGTGIYITIFPTPWELSTIYSVPRFILLASFAVLGMVTWIIFAHNLWEKPTKKGDVRLRKLYNYTTITTLLVIILINYVVLFCLFLSAIGIFVPPGLFEAGAELQGDPSIKHYFQLTWLVTSLGTLAGSIGTASEDEDKIRQITYSYRQANRYYEIENENKVKQDDGDRQTHSKDSQLIENTRGDY